MSAIVLLMLFCTAFVITAGMLGLYHVTTMAAQYFRARVVFWRKVREGVKSLPAWNGGRPPENRPIAVLLVDSAEVHFGLRIGDRLHTPRLVTFADEIVGWVELPDFPSKWEAAGRWNDAAA